MKPVSFHELGFVCLFAAVCLFFHFFTKDAWVPFLDSANLAFHEAGHPLVSMLSGRLTVYGGTMFQLMFPLAAAAHFHREGLPVGACSSAVWLGENMLNIGRYMADARAHLLPLVGGGDHDWTEIFSRWGVLRWDVHIAGFTRLLGLLIILAAVAFLFRICVAADE